jgi:gliding motility-associated protein GldC
VPKTSLINQNINPKKHKTKVIIPMKSEINFNIHLDENRVPEQIFWTAQDGGVQNEAAKAIMLSIWDSKSKESLRIDLWTKDMPVDEMKLFFHQTLVAMSETYNRATGDEKMTATMKDFSDYFAEKSELLKK